MPVVRISKGRWILVESCLKGIAILAFSGSLYFEGGRETSSIVRWLTFHIVDQAKSQASGSAWSSEPNILLTWVQPLPASGEEDLAGGNVEVLRALELF